MAYDATQARQELLDDVGTAIDALATALAALGAAYDVLDEPTGGVLEAELFGPVQHALGRARRTSSVFAARHGLVDRGAAGAPAPAPAGRGVRELLDVAIAAVGRADGGLAALQDSMRPVEVGDPELRSGLSEVRTLVGDVPARAHRIQSRLGR